MEYPVDLGYRLFGTFYYGDGSQIKYGLDVIEADKSDDFKYQIMLPINHIGLAGEPNKTRKASNPSTFTEPSPLGIGFAIAHYGKLRNHDQKVGY